MLLFFRNRATNAFQLVTGVFLSSSGASRRIIDTFNHMGLSVSYQWVSSLLPCCPVSYLQKISEPFKLHCVHYQKMLNFELSHSPPNQVNFGVWSMITLTSPYELHLSVSTQQLSSSMQPLWLFFLFRRSIPDQHMLLRFLLLSDAKNLGFESF
jgi:hypothetical protein